MSKKLYLDKQLPAVDASGDAQPLLVDENRKLAIVSDIPGLDIPAHDYIAISYSGADPIMVVYKTGGSSGTTVATLTLAYTDGKLTSVAKS